MAFKDITKVFYDGKWKVDYKDGNHSYYARPRINWDLPEADPKAWGKAERPKSATGLLSGVLEKNGLMKWPMGLALRELFGFYDFETNGGERKTGFSKEIGTLWLDGKLAPFTQDEVLPLLLSASKASDRAKQKGADIGSVVHDAIEHYILKKPFDIAEQYMWNIKEAVFVDEGERELKLEQFEEDVLMATNAFLQFEKWWLTVGATLFGAEDILFSEKEMMVGTYDADLGIPLDRHPLFNGPTENLDLKFAEVYARVKEKGYVRCTTDWKTSKASRSKDAAMPEGINYSYFIQDAIYEIMRRELGLEHSDDLLVVSARKDGTFGLIYASELGLTVDECIEAALNVRGLSTFIEKTKKALWNRGEEKGLV
jgi:hypothetical protein